MVSWKKGKLHQTSCWLTSWLKPSGKHIFFCSPRASSPFGKAARSHSRVPRKRRRARSLRLAALATIVGYYVCRSGSYSLISHWWQGSPLIWFWNILYALCTFLRSAKSGTGFEDGVGDVVPGSLQIISWFTTKMGDFISPFLRLPSECCGFQSIWHPSALFRF